jgi:hypothetical protein
MTNPSRFDFLFMTLLLSLFVLGTFSLPPVKIDGTTPPPIPSTPDDPDEVPEQDEAGDDTLSPPFVHGEEDPPLGPDSPAVPPQPQVVVVDTPSKA